MSLTSYNVLTSFIFQSFIYSYFSVISSDIDEMRHELNVRNGFLQEKKLQKMFMI